MRLKANAGKLAGWTGAARIDIDGSTSSCGVPVLVVEGSGPVSPAEAGRADYEIIEATEGERDALWAAGYWLRGV